MVGGRGIIEEKPGQIILWICTIGTVAGLWMTGASRQLQNREKRSLDDKLKELDSKSGLPGGGDMINNVHGSLKCIEILICGRPLVIEPYLPLVDAFVMAWLAGTEGQGVTNVIFGDYDFQGKLPRPWFKSVDQLPMSAGDEHYDPLFFWVLD